VRHKQPKPHTCVADAVIVYWRPYVSPETFEQWYRQAVAISDRNNSTVLGANHLFEARTIIGPHLLPYRRLA
jgi:hypothetical protein